MGPNSQMVVYVDPLGNLTSDALQSYGGEWPGAIDGQVDDSPYDQKPGCDNPLY